MDVKTIESVHDVKVRWEYIH